MDNREPQLLQTKKKEDSNTLEHFSLQKDPIASQVLGGFYLVTKDITFWEKNITYKWRLKAATVWWCMAVYHTVYIHDTLFGDMQSAIALKKCVNMITMAMKCGEDQARKDVN